MFNQGPAPSHGEAESSKSGLLPIGMRPAPRDPYGDDQRAHHQQNSEKRCAGCIVGFADENAGSGERYSYGGHRKSDGQVFGGQFHEVILFEMIHGADTTPKV